MFYSSPSYAFKILGIFYVERENRDIYEQNRTHAAISYRIKGCSTFHFRGQQLPADSGAITYIPAGCDYRHINTDHEKIIVLHLEHIGPGGSDLEIETDAHALEPLFRTLLEVWEEGSPGYYNRCMALLYTIFETLQVNAERSAPAIPAAIAPGVTLLHKSFRDPRLTVAQLAQTCFVSEVYFRRVYHIYAGQSPLQTILQLRFQYAKNLLSSGYYTVTQAATLSGFSDVKYFRTAFKKHTGQTPSQFAAKSRGHR